MGFSKMIEEIQKIEKGKIILINCGIFYIARGRDAILLNKIVDLKLSCMESGACKVGFPIASLEKYKKLIEEKGYKYIVYKYDGKENKLTILCEYKGKRKNKILEDTKDCENCANSSNSFSRENKYKKAIKELYK